MDTNKTLNLPRAPWIAASLIACTLGCSREPSPDSAPAAAVDAAPTSEGSEATQAAAATPTKTTTKTPIAAAPLAPLPMPGGPDATGNVATDVQAALGAADCTIAEGRLVDCPAKDAFHKAHSNFVVAKAPDHVRTLFNLLGAKEPQVRMLVLDADPIFYASVYDKEAADDPKLYEPLLAAALAETSSDVRSAFAYAVGNVPVYAEHPRLIAYLGAIGERYGAADDGHKIINALADLWNDECPQCHDALLGIARRNSDPRMRVRATTALDREETSPSALCELAAANLDAEDEDDARAMVDLLTRSESGCDAHFDAWLAEFPARGKAGTLPPAWLDGAYALTEGDRAKTFGPKVRAMAKQLQSALGEEHELRGSIDELAAPPDPA